ncbi:hypothetical protein BOX15_Mlig023537g1, partial [Macrostomum lignano]
MADRMQDQSVHTAVRPGAAPGKEASSAKRNPNIVMRQPPAESANRNSSDLDGDNIQPPQQPPPVAPKPKGKKKDKKEKDKD